VIAVETKKVIHKDVIYASNTLKISAAQLVKACSSSHKLIGLHFFSHVEKMVLEDVIKGDEISEIIVAAVLNYITASVKVPTIVNDGWGFFTSGVFSKFIKEGITILA
jgi:3-hydroxyacyl-CoA dehydrogenase/enoyl-CoA hydratase/3-hydroxybutyryl-CoA epimerase